MYTQSMDLMAKCIRELAERGCSAYEIADRLWVTVEYVQYILDLVRVT